MVERWQIKRIHYSAALGFLVAMTIHFKSPATVILGYALFGGLTAWRFRSLEWKAWKAFIPSVIVIAVTLLAPVLDAQSVAAWHGIALFAQLFMSVAAGIATSPHDPISPKQALARDVLAKRRRLRRTLRETQPIRDAQHREVAKLKAINAERQAYVAAHGHKMTDELKTLKARFDAQKAVLDPIAAESLAATERMQAETEELKQAREAWKNRNKKAA
jgi:hypothetical protein